MSDEAELYLQRAENGDNVVTVSFVEDDNPSTSDVVKFKYESSGWSYHDGNGYQSVSEAALDTTLDSDFKRLARSLGNKDEKDGYQVFRDARLPLDPNKPMTSVPPLSAAPAAQAPVAPPPAESAPVTASTESDGLMAAS